MFVIFQDEPPRSYAAVAANDKVNVRMLPQAIRGKQVIKSLQELLSNESTAQRYQAMLDMPEPVFIGVPVLLGQAQVVRHTPHLLGAIAPLRNFDFHVEVYFTPDPRSGDDVIFKQVFRNRHIEPIRIASMTGIQEPSHSYYMNDEKGWYIDCRNDRGLPLLVDFTTVCSAIVHVKYSFYTTHASFSTTKQIRIGQLTESLTYFGYLSSGLRHHENIARQRAALHCKWPHYLKAVTYESAILNKDTVSRSRQWDEAMQFLATPETAIWPMGQVPYHAMHQYLPEEQIWHERVKLLYPDGQFDSEWLPAVATLVSVAPVLTLKDVQVFIACCKMENIHYLSPDKAAMKFHYHPAPAAYCMNALSTYSAEAYTEPTGLLRLRFVQARRHHDQLCSKVFLELEKQSPSILSAEDQKLFNPASVASSTVFNCCTSCNPDELCHCKSSRIMPHIRPMHATNMQPGTLDANSPSTSQNPEYAPTRLAVTRPPTPSWSTEFQASMDTTTTAHPAYQPLQDVVMTEFQAELMMRQRKRVHQAEIDPAGASTLSFIDPDEPTRIKSIKLTSDDRVELAPLSSIPPRLYDPPVIPAQFPPQVEICEPPADPTLDRTKRLYPDIAHMLYPEAPHTDHQMFLHDLKRVRTWLDNRMIVWYKPLPGILVRNEIDIRTSMQFVFHHLRLLTYLLRKEWLKHLLMELPEMPYPPGKVRIQVPEAELHDLIWPHLNQTFIREVQVSFNHSPGDEEHEDSEYPTHLDHLHVVISQMENSVIGVSFGYKRRKFLSASSAYWASQLPPPGKPDVAPPPGCTTPRLQRAHALSHMTESDRSRFEAYVDDLEIDQASKQAAKTLMNLKQLASSCKQQACTAAATYLESLEAPMDLSTPASPMMTSTEYYASTQL